ncbi:OmpA family protein [Patiriisocius marinus]|uniref:OmpA family protein n=1 Tax=Patiriisocius marinus TaxID=1397112 RepID=UPI00232F9BF5|nr:OmpA family protein [Patiriisocius marinus]
MSKKAMYLLGILLTILIGTYFYWKLCCNECCNDDATKAGSKKEKSLNEKVNSKVSTEKATSNAFALSDAESGFGYSSNDNFNFDTNGFAILDPVASSIDTGLVKLKSFLDSNVDKTIDIKGHYTSTETNNSAYPNLGLARANAVKNYMVSNGINSRQINTMSNLNDTLIPDGTIYKGPVTYSFTTVTDDLAQKAADNLAAIKVRLNASPLTLYFNTGEASIDLTTEQRQIIADLSKYLDKVPSSKLSIVGHTDNTGSRATNIQLGQGRADFAKKYFINNGISEAKIETSSRGPDTPVTTNDTEIGRSKNRRTVVSLN